MSALTTGPLSDATLAAGAFEHRAATNNRFNYNNINLEEVWRQAIDVNGDGRVDIIDAAEVMHPGKLRPGHGQLANPRARRATSR